MTKSYYSKRIHDLRRTAESDAWEHLADHLTNLRKIRDAAMASENYTAALGAQNSIGKACGHDVFRVNHSGNLNIMQEHNLSHLTVEQLNQLEALLYPKEKDIIEGEFYDTDA